MLPGNGSDEHVERESKRELNPALAVVAAARNIPRQLFLKHARSIYRRFVSWKGRCDR
jgi:hypothetical protein